MQVCDTTTLYILQYSSKVKASNFKTKRFNISTNMVLLILLWQIAIFASQPAVFETYEVFFLVCWYSPSPSNWRPWMCAYSTSIKHQQCNFFSLTTSTFCTTFTDSAHKWYFEFPKILVKTSDHNMNLSRYCT